MPTATTSSSSFTEAIPVNLYGLSEVNSKYLDFDNQRVYVYCDYTSKSGVTNKYLNYIDSEDKERFVGCFEKNDIPAQPDQAEDYGKDPDVKYVPWID